ncbi:GNAT family N-acetyltransferase [Agromyces sp. CFH 90414]|uniref:GNAT family N-acetyltransferase n=1 Tax=Agromyces agglutinans TaxID=2662258 RepID=A0A6I2FD86_9MICO|nr:GNAT family N-acetyltransferase [Agromyces agglutinans]MRG59048.1 GNAT family N-acetyltransferase [Agromyces agglutinans]
MTESATIETPRLLLRPLSREQAERVASHERVGQPWAAGYPREDDRDVARTALGDPPVEPLFGPLQIVERATGLVVGGIGCFGPPDADGVVALGYGVVPDVEGRGYATEALRAVLAHAFGTGRVLRATADTSQENLGSQRVLEKAGMRRIGERDGLVYYELTQHDRARRTSARAAATAEAAEPRGIRPPA